MNVRIPCLISFLMVASISGVMAAPAKAPDCADWPGSIAYGTLKNAGMIDPDQMDFTATKATRLAAEPRGHGLYREVYHITFREKTGKTFDVITTSDASNEECSMSGVDVFIVTAHPDPGL